jgi:signal transduction histidine kinase
VNPNPALFLLLAFFSVALASLVRFKARPGPVTTYFSLFAIAVAGWLVSGFLLYSDIDPPRAVLWARLAFAAGTVIILALYHVLALFPDQPSSRFAPYVNFVGAGLALASITSPLLARDVTTQGPLQIKVEYGALFLPFTAYAITVLALGGWALLKRFLGSTGIRRLQIKYLLLGTVIPVAGVLITNLILPLVFGVSDFNPYGRFLALIFLPVTAHAIIRHRIMDIKLFVQKAVVYACAVAASAAIFGVLLWIIGAVTPGTPRMSAQEPVALAILIAILFQPVKNAIERGFNRYVYRERPDYSRILKESSEALSTALDSQAAAEYVTRLVSGMFKAEPVVVFRRDPGHDAFVPVGSVATDNLPTVSVPLTPASLSPSSPLPSYLSGIARVLLRDDAIVTPGEMRARAAMAELRSLRGDVAIAFWHFDKLWGFIVIGQKLSGDPYFSEDVDFLMTLGSQTAVAIENFQLHRRMEEERLRAERLGVIGTIASGIAHEIKNPLVAIRTFAELLPDRIGDEEFHGQFAKVVIGEIGRIDRLILRLRELATRPVQEITTLDIRKPLDETLLLLRAQIEQKGVRVVRQYERDVPSIVGEEDLLKQLFLNLCINAIEAMEPGGQLSVRVLARSVAGLERVVLEVSDTGDGIPEEALTKIFNPFFSTKTTGSGLGLAICRSIADAHGATIRAYNNSGRLGATFAVEFKVGGSRATVHSAQPLEDHRLLRTTKS